MRNPEQEALQAILRSDIAPNAEQEKRFIGFLQRKYEREISLVWEEDKTLRGGFRLQVGSDVYDWSVEGRLRQLRERLERLKADRASVILLMLWLYTVCTVILSGAAFNIVIRDLKARDT